MARPKRINRYPIVEMINELKAMTPDEAVEYQAFLNQLRESTSQWVSENRKAKLGRRRKDQKSDPTPDVCCEPDAERSE